jgi:MoaA/NifB/PqqE/SkfB family radical SAM enzyme
LRETRLVDESSCINLYNWGEPLLHPELADILGVLDDRRIAYSLSTNASKCVPVKKQTMRHMRQLTISMPGFSQRSYDEIHGFDFEKIKANIDILLATFKSAGFVGNTLLAYHVYQFNIDEIGAAMKFCARRKIHFSPVAAYMNDYNLSKAYLDGQLSRELLAKASKQLLLSYVDDLVKRCPADYRCPQHDYLTIDESCNVLTCCIVPRSHPDYSVGNVFTLAAEDVVRKKASRGVCVECRQSGVAYWAHNPHVPKFIEDLKQVSLMNRIRAKRTAVCRYLRSAASRIGE